MIAKQGLKMAARGLSLAIVGSFPFFGIARWPLAVVGAGFAAFSVYFFRDPERPLPTDAGKVYSPGDGRVLSVAREGPGGVTTVRIFLSIFDVHIQRVPCAGTVEQVRYQPGKFLMAMRDEARYNERSIVVLKPSGGRPNLIVEQIAGAVARRIETWCKPGDAVAAGQRYGIIYFGSQAAVHMPAGLSPTVKPGDRVYAGLTEIGEWTA